MQQTRSYTVVSPPTPSIWSQLKHHFFIDHSSLVNDPHSSGPPPKCFLQRVPHWGEILRLYFFPYPLLLMRETGVFGFSRPYIALFPPTTLFIQKKPKISFPPKESSPHAFPFYCENALPIFFPNPETPLQFMLPNTFHLLPLISSPFFRKQRRYS